MGEIPMIMWLLPLLVVGLVVSMLFRAFRLLGGSATDIAKERQALRQSRLEFLRAAKEADRLLAEKAIAAENGEEAEDLNPDAPDEGHDVKRDD